MQHVLDEASATVDVERPLPDVLADAGQLVQLFTNLLGNAVKYSRPGVPPHVRVAATSGSGEVCITVSDNGIGIPEHQRERMFRIFQRLHGREIPGTGIGLAICRKIVEQHHGRIEVVTDGGEGTTFAITLPEAT